MGKGAQGIIISRFISPDRLLPASLSLEPGVDQTTVSELTHKNRGLNCLPLIQRANAPCIVLHFARRTQRLGGYTHVGDIVKRAHPEITAAQVVVDHTHLNILGA